MGRLRWLNRIAASWTASFALVSTAPAAMPVTAEGDSAKPLQATTNASPLVLGALAGVAFADASNGIAVGGAAYAGALILRTADAGSTWSKQVAPSNANLLKGVAFVGASSGWAVGSTTSNGGLVLATVDGGSNWNAQTLPAGVGPLSAVSFTSSTAGWAVGGASIIATTNGGATWTSQTVPSGVIALNGVAFASATTGWAVGGQSGATGVILATSNGGATWTKQATPSGSYLLNGITSTSTTTAWAVGNGSQGVILATTDGGTTWTPQTTPTSSSSLGGVAFSGSAGWAVGGDSNNTRVILHTTNGGGTWAQQAPPPSVHSALTAIAATGPTSAVAVGAGDCGSPAILTTADGGATWTSQIGQRVAVHALNAVAFATAAKGWAVGNDTCSSGVVLATQNGGATWQRQSLPATVDDLSAVTFGSATTGWAVGNQNHRSPTHGGTTIVATTDGGVTWLEQAHPSLLLLSTGVASFGVNLAWATGSDGSNAIILATTDGGTTWNKQTVPAGVGTLSAISFINATTGWAVGTKAGSNAGVILATTNGGTTWLSQTPPATAGSLVALSFVSASSGWVVGNTTSYQAEILATTNGGTTWAAQTPPGAQSQVQAVSFASAAAGWTVGTGISATTDGGLTWLRQAGFPTRYLNGVASSGVNDAWAVGWSSCQQPYGLNAGTIVATTDGGTNWSTQFDDCPPVVPAVTGVAPISGNSTGGTRVSIAGTGFTGATGVSFGSTPATSFTVNSDTSITATNPAGSTGTVDVTVSNPAATSGTSSADTYVYVPPAISWQQYTLPGSNGTTWQPIDAANLSSSFTPTVAGNAILSGNADLWTSLAGVNQDLGILVSGGSYASGTLVGWKESGGFAGTFSPNAAFVQTVIPVAASTTYTAQLVWKSNKATSGTIVVAAGNGFPFSPTRLTAELVPNTAGANLQSVASSSQYLMNGSDGASWKDVDATNLIISNFTPAATGTALISGNADLWTIEAGVNQDIGIQVSGGSFGSGQMVGWKESGGFAGTFSPNAAFAQTAVQLTGGTAYTIKLQWKANKSTTGTIVIGAGPWPSPGSSYSPTRLSMHFFPAGTGVNDASVVQQYTRTGSNGMDWVPIDSANLKTTVTPAANSLYILSANADLWTATAGVNQDMGIFVSGGAFGSGMLVAWKESGGFAGTFSPNAAFVQTVLPLTGGMSYTVTLEWKANKATSGTIVVAAGGAGNFSPTRVTAQLMS